MLNDFKYVKMRYAVPLFFLFPSVFTVVFGIVSPEIVATKFNFLMCLSYCILIFILYKQSEMELKKQFKQLGTKQVLKDVGVVFIAQLLFSIATQNIVIAISYQLNPDTTNELYLLNSVDFANVSDLIWMVIFASLTVPILEEYIFRGVIFSRIYHKTNLIWAILISSMVFGVLHDLDTLGATLFAIFGCILYMKYQNILVPILLHILNNTAASIQIVINPEVYKSLEPLSDEIIREGLINGLIMLPFSLVFIYWAYRCLKYHRIKNGHGEIVLRKVL